MITPLVIFSLQVWINFKSLTRSS